MAQGVAAWDWWDRPGMRRPTPDHPSDASKPPYIALSPSERRRLREWTVVQPGTLCLGWGGPVTSAGVPWARGMGRPIHAANLLLADMGLPVSRSTPVRRTCGTAGCMAPAHMEPMFDPLWKPWPLPQPAARPGPDRRQVAARRLSDVQVWAARHRYVWGGESITALAGWADVALNTMSKVLSGVTYVDVSGGTDVRRRDAPAALKIRNGRPGRSDGLHYRARLTPDTVRWIVDNHRDIPVKDMAERLGVAQNTVRGVLWGRTWKHITGGPVTPAGGGRTPPPGGDSTQKRGTDAR